MENPQKSLVLGLLAYAAHKDVDPERLCNLSSIDLQVLKGKGKELITPKQLSDLWLNAVHLTNDPLLGLHFGESLQLAALGSVGQLVQSCATVGEALTHACGAIRLITDLFSMEVSHSDRSFTIHFVPDSDKERGFVLRQMMELFMAFTLHEADGLILKKIRPQAVCIPYNLSKPEEYERVLRVKAIRKSGDYSLEFESRYWNEPILTANYELQNLLLKKVSEQNRDFENAKALKERISSYLLTNAYLGIPTLEQMAANFNTSPRSLQRKLQEEGVTYQQVADAIRKSLAINYLSSGSYPVKEISYILGYNELSAFSRAFKRWTGTTPGHFQRQQLA
ncbi:AraC family transcriptional regulator ligand-binding domain-containing protein [Larkinella insperata]|uniref:AraC family transcriptional regulator ligand-binding domain-containing protein n=1 Tax=Larkinella insperata TaxID=332158 RepID=A0ABW3QJC6_9BACT|nr:AraC family transcriptional regulator [Larkinella insperata]